ncbi:MAG: sulfotransferase, partial [Gammaproteobacteria bacterium]
MTELGERDRALAEVRRAQDDGRLGDARELLKLLKRRLPPDDCELLAAEGLQALGEGRMREAAGLLQRALASGATDPEVLFALGRLTAMAGRPDQAVPLLSRAAEQRPDHADTWLTLGICQNALALSHAALESFDQALGINPGLAEAHAQSGAIRLAAGEFAAARKALGKALACQPGHAAARISLAVACEMQGQTTEGLEALEPLFMNNHPPTRARLARARLLRRAGDFELARSELETLLKRTDLEPGDRGRAEFLLAELDDKAGRPDSAFVHAAEGCRLKSVRYDPRQDEHAADVVMRYFNAERLASLARARSTGPGPVFIVGMPRSGTSLLEQMLGAHPATRPCGETSLVTNLAAEIARRLGGFPGGLDKATEADLTALAHDYRQALGKSDGLILDKTVTNFWHLGLIDRLFPDARIIHCTRDPRDTLLSC